MIRVKICGITRPADAKAALRAGAHALGFVFAKSPRRVSPEQASRILVDLGPWVYGVGVFVNEKPETVARTARRCKLAAVQLHGDEGKKALKSLSNEAFSVIKAFRVGPEFDFSGLDEVRADAVLLDAAAPGLYGGSGRSFDWNGLKKLRTEKPVIISGGLNAANVSALLRRFRPYGVDVSSGVESSPGKKSARKIHAFIQQVRKYETAS